MFFHSGESSLLNSFLNNEAILFVKSCLHFYSNTHKFSNHFLDKKNSQPYKIWQAPKKVCILKAVHVRKNVNMSKRASKIRTVLHIFDWLIFHYFLLLMLRLTPLTSAATSNEKLVNQKLCNTVLNFDAL